MSNTIGTATNYFDLLTKLKNFLVNTGHAWGLAYTGTGNGRMVGAIGKSASVVQTITCTATSSTSFTISGSVTGSMGTATVGTLFTHAQCDFTINAGGTAYVSGDVYTFSLSPKWTALRFGGCGDPVLRTASVAGAAGMFDGTTGTTSISVANASLPVQVQVQMQATIEVKAFSLWNGGSTTLAPTAYSLQYSDDGSAWTTAQSFTGQTWTATFQRKDHVLSASAGSHLYWRLNVTAGGATVNMAELQLFADAGFKWACSHSFQFQFRGPGIDGAQQIHVVGTTNINSGTGAYNLIFRGVRFLLDPDLDNSNIVAVSLQHTHCLNNNSTSYWIVANGNRFMVATRLSGVYEMSYCGFGFPYETPTNHPYPIMIGAPSDSATRLFSDSSTFTFRNPSDPGDDGLEVMMPAGLWQTCSNRSTGGSAPDGSTAGASTGKTWPWAGTDLGNQQMSIYWKEALDGTKPIFPGVVIVPPSDHVWGEFDGLCWTTGFNNAAEALTQVGAIDFLSFPNVYRTGVAHYSAIALD